VFNFNHQFYFPDLISNLLDKELQGSRCSAPKYL